MGWGGSRDLVGGGSDNARSLGVQSSDLQMIVAGDGWARMACVKWPPLGSNDHLLC